MRVGFDEVGRGALAGPVVVSLVASPENWPLKIHSKATASEKKFYEKKDTLLAKVNDSKKVRPHTRKKISEFVKQYEFPHIVLSGSNQLIDDFGIGKVLTHLLGIGLEIISNKLKANSVIKVYIDGRIKLIKLDPLLVSKLLVENNLETTIDHTILVRQMQTDMLSGFEKFSLIREDRADALYLPVALASNVAKVYRDELMVNLSSVYPQFGWENNMGYGTKHHREAITKYPDNQWLRKTWLKNILANTTKE